MSSRALIFAIPVLCAAGFPALSANANASQPISLDDGYRQMYDLRFADAHETFRQYQLAHPDDPMGPVSDAAAYLFSEFDRLHILQSEFFTHDQHFITDHKLTPDPELKKKFEAAIEATRTLCNRKPDDRNSRFASVLRNGLHSDYLALIEKRYGVSLAEMKQGRVEAEKLLAANPEMYDAWLAVGVENYMLSIKAAPIRWFLKLGGARTDRATGLEKLKLVADKGHYLAPFARLLLAVAALRDNDRNTARNLLANLISQYPNNVLFRQELARLSPAMARSEIR
jgi:hypothetical protein